MYLYKMGFGMLDVSIGEIQKNTAIFSNLTEAVQVIDKRKNKRLAIIYPVDSHSFIESLAGKYKNTIKNTELDFQQIKNKAMQIAMEDKYGLSS